MWDLVSLFFSIVVLLLLLDIFVTPIGLLKRAKSVIGSKACVSDSFASNELVARIDELEKRLEILEKKN